MSAAAWKGFAVIPPAYRRVLLSAWQARRNRGSMWFFGLAGLLFASLPILVWWFTHQQTLQLTIIATAAVTIVFLVAAWSMLAFNVLLQNHPHTARLLPAQVPVLRNTLLSTAALLCAVATLLSWLAGGPVLAMAAGMAVGLASLALCLSWLWLWWVFGGLAWSLQYLGARGELNGVIWLWHTAPEVHTLLAFVLAAIALRAVVMTGNARHERAHARMKLMSATMRGQMPGNSVQRTLKVGKNSYASWMNHVLTRVQPKVGARLALGLGPRAHWSSLLEAQFLGLMLMTMTLLVLQWFSSSWGTIQHAYKGLMIGNLVGGLAVTVVQLPMALWASRHEQSLLRLLPGAPQGVLLNRWLVARLASVHLAMLVMQGLLVFGVSHFVDSEAFAGQAVEIAVSALILTMPLTFTLWRNWASTKAPGGSAQVLMILATLVILILAAVWIDLLHRPWYELAALTLLLMLPLGWWRWRVISRAPAAWPVGRLG